MGQSTLGIFFRRGVSVVFRGLAVSHLRENKFEEGKKMESKFCYTFSDVYSDTLITF